MYTNAKKATGHPMGHAVCYSGIKRQTSHKKERESFHLMDGLEEKTICDFHLKFNTTQYSAYYTTIQCSSHSEFHNYY